MRIRWFNTNKVLFIMAGTQSILCVGYYHCWYWLDIEWCKTHPGPKQSKREKAGSILSSISHSLMPSYSFAHLNPRNHGSMGHCKNWFWWFWWLCTDSESSRPTSVSSNCVQSVGCHWCQSWNGLQQAAWFLVPDLTWRTVLFGPEQRRSLSYKPRNEVEVLVKQASCLITTKSQIAGE